MPCSTHRRTADAVRPGGLAEVASSRFVHEAAHLHRVASQSPFAARFQLTPEKTARWRICRLGTTPIPASNGRPQARNKEGSCGDGQY